MTNASLRAQQDPRVSTEPPCWDAAIEDIKARDAHGRTKYGQPVRALNGRNPIIDAYQEALDAVVYLRQALDETALLGHDVLDIKELLEEALAHDVPSVRTLRTRQALGCIEALLIKYPFLKG